MVGTRWESSNRPLFVRTVWKDGHHHVVLRKDEQVTQTARSARRSVSSGTSRSRKTLPPSSDSSVNFKVPSVKLLLAGLRNFNDTRAKRCKTESRDFLKTALTVDIIPSDSVRLNDINKQVSFKNETAFKLAARSNSIEVNRCCRESDGAASPPPFSYDNYCLDQFNNSLSERVMIWLDLATQNRKHFDNVDLKKRIVTAHACPISQREKAGVRNLKTKRSVMERHQSCEQSKTKELVFDDKEQEAPLVTSQMECDPPEQVNEERTVKMRSNTAKRQLHIFLPNLPKKSSESGSFLSSKASSLFQANKL